MSELSVTHVGPALVVVIEVEGPTRLLLGAEGEPDRRALLDWIDSSELRGAIVQAALADRADPERTESWLDWISPAEPSSSRSRHA